MNDRLQEIRDRLTGGAYATYDEHDTVNASTMNAATADLQWLLYRVEAMESKSFVRCDSWAKGVVPNGMKDIAVQTIDVGICRCIRRSFHDGNHVGYVDGKSLTWEQDRR